MGRRLRCSSVTSRTSFEGRRGKPDRHKPKTGAGCALLAPCRRPILNATTSSLYVRRYSEMFASLTIHIDFASDEAS